MGLCEYPEDLIREGSANRLDSGEVEDDRLEQIDPREDPLGLGA